MKVQGFSLVVKNIVAKEDEVDTAMVLSKLLPLTVKWLASILSDAIHHQ
eukprot:CAMPEP_0172313700 /NCGR_PEP_ID=MMETSP1058-20130122/20791_1 /TAXON_ID=83371 /ORGANISM="Detonula confervacea, Strain CCMP 353" /LENGTH=48 /DNA_ID= /DNA_START= /DNA_END= /DNA_ORIENTATION=